MLPVMRRNMFGFRQRLRRLRSLFDRDRLDDQLREEIDAHIELRRQQLVADGMDPRDAESAARRSFGNVTAIREETRSLWGTAVLDMVMALYGVIVYATSQRTREIGIRMALGAPAGSVTRLMMRDAVMLAVAGVSIGAVLALAAGSALSSLLIGIGAADPVSFVAAAVLVLLVAASASYLPARRAARIEPVQALRSE